jgi:hypothetical protein
MPLFGKRVFAQRFALLPRYLRLGLCRVYLHVRTNIRLVPVATSHTCQWGMYAPRKAANPAECHSAAFSFFA